jgi:glutamate-1-semialdehyde 2,1-aminomutase
MAATRPNAGVAVDPEPFDAVLLERAKVITERELARYAERTVASQRATARARKVLPLGVPSSFQAYDPHPIVVRHAAGPHMVDVDGHEYVDFDMGFGALFAGHMNPLVRAAVEAQLGDGSLYVTPCELNAEVAELLRDRYRLPMWRFTNSGTEATMDAIRLARGATGRTRIAKVEGGYHGHHDEVMISMKPPLELAGPPDAPNSVPGTEGIPPDVVAATVVVPYNDLDALERVLRSGDVACFILEPVMENIGICLPDDGYLQGVRDLTTRHGTLLIFDEVKTGITAGYGGATGHFGIEPDLVALAKSIGGGFPIGAFGGTQEIMDLITTGRVLHLGTYNGNPLVMAAAKATLAEACDSVATDAAITRNQRLVAACQEVIDGARLPAHTVQFGAKGCVTWRRDRVRNYRDYKAGHLELAFSQWIHGINRGILLPPGLDEQWLVSVMHDDGTAMRYAEVFGEFAAELTG